MRHTTRAVAIAGVVAAVTATAAGPAAATAGHRPSGAVFVQANGLDGNTIVAYDRQLHPAGTFATGAAAASRRARPPTRSPRRARSPSMPATTCCTR
ncbi:hypothetical protein ACWEOZ_12395 [Actinoplanes sp. NPDC004185]